jgi:MSHA biogenesis protein MshI
MNIGWRDYIKSRFRKASQFHSVGIMFDTKGIQISSTQKVKGELVWVKQHFVEITNWQQDLKSYVEKHNLGNTQCNVVMSITKYKIMHMDRPAVQDEEVIDALQWSVKEQLSTDESLIIDYFEPPVASNNTQQLNVVALSEKEIVQIRNGILQAGLRLDHIGIEELAICNICEFSDDAAIVLKQQSGGQISLNIVKQNQLYFSRRLKGYENIGSLSPEELTMGVADNLSLEVQRSMDYFESQLRQAPVKKVFVALDTIHQDALAELIKEVVFVTVEKFVPNVQADVNLPILSPSFASLSAAIVKPQVVA